MVIAGLTISLAAVASFVLVVALGFVIGLLSAMLGVGGGTLMVPIFRLAMGLSALQCTATSLFCVILTSISGAATRIKNHLCSVPMGVAIGCAGACTSSLGAWLSQRSASWLVMLMAAVCIGYAAVNMFRNARRADAGAPSGNAAGAAAAVAAAEASPTSGVDGLGLAVGESVTATAAGASAYPMTPRRVVFGVVLGLVVGVASGYVGLGGGFIIVPVLMHVGKMPFKLASGTSLVAIMLLAIPGVVVQAAAGNVVFWVGIAIAIGSIPGALVGGRVVKRVDDRKLCQGFGILLLVSAVVLVGKEIASLA